ncbi:MAG: universal stress protein [Actinomycetota bacterium]|nr:universal stress protein [Actinomycetota bacterium]
MSYKRILVGTDGSESASKAVDLAAGLAAALSAELLIVHAGSDESILEPAVKSASTLGVKVTSEFRGGHPSEVLIDFADEKNVDLIVVGDKGQSKGKRVFLGGVPDQVSQHAGCDVLIMRTTSEQSAEGYERVLIATDGSKTADRAARKGLAIAASLGAKVSLVHAGHPKTGQLLLEDTAKNLVSGAPIEAELHPVQGNPAEAILEVAEKDRADLIVVGNKGMTGAKRLLLGSVPLAISQYSPCDVLIVRTTTVFAAELGKGEGAIITVDDKQVAAYRKDDGSLVTLSPRCTHMGCTVGWNAFDKTWDCPCHGSRFTSDGDMHNGPATKPLDKADV